MYCYPHVQAKGSESSVKWGGRGAIGCLTPLSNCTSGVTMSHRHGVAIKMVHGVGKSEGEEQRSYRPSEQ